MLNINQKIELKRECIDIPQAIKSGYNIVEVSKKFLYYNHVEKFYNVVPAYFFIEIVKRNIGIFTKIIVVDTVYSNIINPDEAYGFVKFFINMQEYGKQ